MEQSEADVSNVQQAVPFFGINMILTLERRGLIKRTPGRARSIEVVVPLNEVPPLD